MILKNLDERKVEFLVNEFCKNGNLEEFRDIVSKIIIRINNSGCSISTRYDNEQSLHEDNRNGTCKIRISLKSPSRPLHIIWNILHEFGHHLSGKAESKSPNFEREELAWELAENELKLHPELTQHLESFNKHKTYCLETYNLIKKQ